MKFGIFDHLDRRDEALTGFYEDRLKLIEAADRAGLAGYHLAEHHWNPVGMAPLPGVFLGAAAMRTKNIRIGPLAYALAFHNPLILAEEICMLDHMSGGRFDLGVGRGISPWELQMFGYSLPETRDLFREAMDLMLEYFTSDVLTFRGKRWSYYEVPVEIKPLQRPFPPIWYGSSSGKTKDYLASLGSAMVGGWAPSARIKQAGDAYREAWDKAKDSPWRAGRKGEATVGSVRMVVIGETAAEAEKLAGPAYDRWQQSLEKQAHDFGFRALFLPADANVARKLGVLIFGTAAEVKEQIARHVAESGVNYVCLQLAFGNLTHADEMRTLGLFAEEILPDYAQAPAVAR